jgi:hypothetical protein
VVSTTEAADEDPGEAGALLDAHFTKQARARGVSNSYMC